MKSFGWIVMSSLAAFLVATSTSWAQLPPNNCVLTQCQVVQDEAQAAVVAGVPYKNHGQLVRTAANVVSPHEEVGAISEECASCIMNQFARRIPMEIQSECMDDLNGENEND